MLQEFAISPSVFRTSSYESAAVADLCLRQMGHSLREDGIVRNLCSGEWLDQIRSDQSGVHCKSIELLKKLERGNRLARHPRMGIQIPKDDQDWESEALLSHESRHLTGCIFSQDAWEKRHKRNLLVSCPERLTSASFWTSHARSRRICRSIGAYIDILASLFRHANSIMFIDPHIDPWRGGYSDFWKLLTNPELANREIKPRIEIHRVAWVGDGKDKRPKVEEIKTTFFEESPVHRQKSLNLRLKEAGVTVEVFLWDDLHDRFLMTELLGMSWSNGFDTDKDPSSSVTVARLDRPDRDSVQEEFSANSTRHHLQGRFAIGYRTTI